jgi:hypothetical protein
MTKFNEGDDVIVTTVKYWGRYTEIWRCTFKSYGEDFFTVMTDIGECSFPSWAGIRLADA